MNVETDTARGLIVLTGEDERGGRYIVTLSRSQALALGSSLLRAGATMAPQGQTNEPREAGHE